MSTPSNDAIEAELVAGRLAIGNVVVVSSTGAKSTASSNLYVDSSGQLQSGNLPFELPLYAGTADTSYSVITTRSTVTQTADDALHCTIVQGAAASLTTAGFLRITITDDGGVLTSGKYYIPFGTLS